MHLLWLQNHFCLHVALIGTICLKIKEEQWVPYLNDFDWDLDLSITYPTALKRQLLSEATILRVRKLPSDNPTSVGAPVLEILLIPRPRF